jgi:hypothetical protein
MHLSQRGHVPHAPGEIAAGVKYTPAQFGDFVAYAVVEDEGSQAAAEESKIGYSR